MKTLKSKRRFGKTLKRRGGMPKVVIDNSDRFQNLIDGVGSADILIEFAKFNGRPNMKTIVPDENARITRGMSAIIQQGYTGLAFDTAHWKGYEEGKEKYNSYTAGLQSPGTNNYCQSYAAYLWAKMGDIRPFVKGKYAENVMKMSQIWLDFFKDAKKDRSRWADIKYWFEMVDDIKKHDIQQAITLLTALSTNEPLAREFSQSKQ